MITFLRDWQGYAKGTSINTLEARMEAQAVSDGAAVYGGVGPDLPAYYDASNSATGLVGPDGVVTPLNPFNPQVVDFQPNDLLVTRVDSTGIVLPNPYSGFANAPVHPGVVYAAQPWNGYRYWMAYTPYPSANSAYENPCVAGSNDGVLWTAAGAQPLVGKPASGFNADTHLFFSSDGLTLYLAFRERIAAGNNSLKVMHTTDGVTWSVPVVILSGAQGVTDYASPSIWWNGTGWTCITHQLDAVSPWPVRRNVSSTSDIYGAWGAASTVTITEPSGRSWWHSFCHRLSSGQIVAIFQDNSGAGGGAGNLYWCDSSDDGATFTTGNDVIRNLPALSGYRSAFVAYDLNGKTQIELFLNDLAQLKIFRYLAESGASGARRAFYAAQAASLAVSLAPNAIWGDTFVRADSAVSLGTATSGGTYTASSGTWGISTNRAYPVASGRVLAAAGTAGHEISCEFEDMTTGIQQWLICRAADSANYWRCGVSSPSATGVQTLALQSIVAGAVVVNTAVGRFQRGDTVTLMASGRVLQISVNGIRVASYVMTTALTGTSFGMQANAGANTFMKNLTCVTA